jgi:hypothetical protein
MLIKRLQLLSTLQKVFVKVKQNFLGLALGRRELLDLLLIDGLPLFCGHIIKFFSCHRSILALVGVGERPSNVKSETIESDGKPDLTLIQRFGDKNR